MTDLSGIKAFAFDIDGVFTDGGILCDLDGELYRTYDAKDCFAVRMATMKGYCVGILTGASTTAVRVRMLGLGLDPCNVYLKSRDKVLDMEKFCQRNGLKAEEVLYMGDDIPDIPVFSRVGLSCCPSDACEEAREAADLVLEHPGGKGAVREIVRAVLKARGDWQFDVENYARKF